MLQMETKLSQLRETMAAEKQKRDAARGVNPTGSVWRSARTDQPTNRAYVEKVLKSKEPARKPAVPKDAASAPKVQPLLTGSVAPAVATNVDAPAAFAKTRASFEWNPASSFANLDAGNDYEDLLGPEEPPPPQEGGGALLQGTYDEAENAAAFAEAVKAWRTGGDADPATVAASRPVPEVGGALLGAGRIDVADAGSMQTSGPSTGANVAGGCAASSGGSLLDGPAFDEAESSASFAEALNAWRRGGSTGAGAEASRPSRFRAAAATSEPTLADKVHALRRELGLPEQSTLVEAVSTANSIVGLQSIGSLSDQVGRLLRETGIRPVAGAATPVVPAATDSHSSARTPQSQPSSAARPQSRSGGVQTQTAPRKNYYELLQEQKRKDGVLG